MVGQWIDTIGKLGPLLVAVAVFLSSIAQNRWVNLLAERSAALGDQKLRLSLLDRRVKAIEALRAGLSTFNEKAEVASSSLSRLIEAAQIAELVFDPNEAEAIGKIMEKLTRWRVLIRDLSEAMRTRSSSAEALKREMVVLQQSVVEEVVALMRRLIESARVSEVPPISRASFRLIHLR